MILSNNRNEKKKGKQVPHAKRENPQFIEETNKNLQEKRIDEQIKSPTENYYYFIPLCSRRVLNSKHFYSY